ncbi:gonadal protein gdl-like isoform X1 [Varroa jacobsoni]|uniref:Gonadal protein gdl n=1 Tax=Varroa destructor TaxID=109461 RepID=A0A7M7MCW1_VARDE|nr:gonadal protein gdl-like [Varroa destructor]XP_022711039.1 gonadal protein gdl-like isoform X1 [Varroa jacobsoni]
MPDMDEWAQLQRETALRVVIEEMWKEIPSDLQDYIPASTLEDLCTALQNPTTLEVVKLLQEVQELREGQLYQQRCDLVGEIKSRLGEVRRQHQERRELQAKAGLSLEELDKELEAQWNLVSDEVKRELNSKDLNIIGEIDSTVVEQQRALQEVGVPHFKETKEPVELRIQMTLLDFLLRIVRMPTFRSSNDDDS